MQMSSSDDWTVQTLGNTDGTGHFQEQTWFEFPTGVFGSVSGTFWQPNAGTEPIFATNGARYRISRDGAVDYICSMFNVNNTPSGSETLDLTLPYINDSPAGHNSVFSTFIDAGTNNRQILTGTINGGSQVITASFFEGTSTSLNNGNFATNDDFNCTIRFWAFNE